jgi:hypothetical protein
MKAWVVTVDMGLGHQRATYPLASLAEGGIFPVGGAEICSPEESRLWGRVRSTYETISRCKSIPLVGTPLFAFMDRLLAIPPYYPVRDLSAPGFQVKLLESLIDRGLCRGMLERIQSKPLPLITSYLAPAIAADRAGYDPIYCIVCDSEVARAWVARDPRESRIRYLVPCERTVLRLRSYGVPGQRISLTGFPMPRELLGDRSLDRLKHDLSRRLSRLDPDGRFWKRHGRSAGPVLGSDKFSAGRHEPLAITFAVGGAGAQGEIGRQIACSLRERLQRGSVRLNLVAGVRKEVKTYFENLKEQLVPGNPNLRVIFGASKTEYFKKFSGILHQTDVLWTKPSELSFYCGLGIPLILSPTIGSQEVFNRKWLLEIGAAIPQENPSYTGQWLFDLLDSGRLAEIAWSGFLNVQKYGTYRIQGILEKAAETRESTGMSLEVA